MVEDLIARSVLFVDDDDVFVTRLSELLIREGCVVRQALSPGQAWQQLEDGRFDVVAISGPHAERIDWIRDAFQALA